MSVNYTPQRGDYKDLTPFRFWCQKILPLVYDDSLSYYELLCKVVDYLNKTMEDVDTLEGDVTGIYNAYNELQKYVNDYFDNLDVQDEIDNKLDRLVSNGTIHDIFNDDVVAILNQGVQARDQAIAAIPANVTNWLNEHVTQETGYVIDDTLSIQGAAADAKVTGGRLGALKSDLSSNNNLINEQHSLVNYDYNESCDFEAVPGSQSGTVIGIKRNYNTVILNGTTGISTVIIRLNSVVTRTISSATVESWTGAIPLKGGHVYKAKLKLLEGVASDNSVSVSVYKSGTRNSVGFYNWSNENEFVRQFTAENANYHVALYVYAEKTFTDAKYIVTLEDVTESNRDDFDYFNEQINLNHGLIDYGYGNVKTSMSPSDIATSETFIGVERFGTIIKLNKNAASDDYAFRVKITGVLERARASQYQAWEGTLQLTEGKRYRVKIVKLSGVSIYNETDYIPGLVVYESKGHDSIASLVSETENEKVFEFVAPSGKINIAVYAKGASVLTDYLCNVTLTEGEQEDYYISELNDTIQKVREVNTEPALVFPWVTDIHRYKAAVQNFDDMVKNMRAFAQSVKCNMILNTGDTIEGDKAQSISLGQAYECIATLKTIGEPLFYVEGNHDNNPYIGSASLVFNLKQVYSGFFTATKNVEFNVNENGTDYYFDFNNLGIRFISLNSCNPTIAFNYGFGNSTSAWLTSALNTNHIVIIATHVSPIKEHVWNNINPGNVSNIRSALSSFVSNGGKLILLTGHSHIDAEFVNPYVEVTDVCQKFDKADITTSGYEVISGQIDGIRNPDRTEGTYTEDAWSVCVFKPISMELDVIRFGAGIDRYIHCEPVGESTLTARFDGAVTWNSSDTSVATVSDGTVSIVGAGRCAIVAKDTSGNIEVWVIDAN